MIFKLIYNDKFFNVNNLNINDKHENVINIIKLYLYKFNHKTDIHFKFLLILIDKLIKRRFRIKTIINDY